MPSWFGEPELAGRAALLRYLLVGIALLGAACMARGRRTAALLAGVLFAVSAGGFWVLSLGRPYGLLEDAAATRRAAEVAVVAATGRAGESFVAGEPIAHPGFVALLKAGLSPEKLNTLPSVLPAFVVAAIGLLVFAVWQRREESAAAALLWLAFATGDLDSARGFGVLPGIWPRPEQALVLVPAAGLALAAGRFPRALGTLLTAAIALACSASSPRSAAPAGADALLLLTLDQLPWLVLGALGLFRAADPASLGLCLGGGLGVLVSAVSGWGSAWSGHALFRLGLVLASASAIQARWAPADEFAQWISRRLGGIAPERVLLALLLAVGAPAAFATWWDPPRIDPVARASQEPISPALVPLMKFIREQTPKDAVFLASPDYAPAVAVLGGRRVLRAPSVLVTADDHRRLRAEGAILAGRPLPAGAADHGVRLLLLAPGDFKARGIARPEDLEGRPGFLTRYADREGYRVYEMVR